jgi:GST-like protein
MASYNPQKTLSLLERALTAEPTASLRALTALRSELDVLERHLTDGNKQFILGDEYTIADMAAGPWISALNQQDTHYKARTFLQMESYTHVQGWLARLEARPGWNRGLRVNTTGPRGVPERHSPADFGEPRL